MLRQLWHWLRRLFQRILGRKKITPPVKIETPQPEIDYESLFLELLAGVADGWSRADVKGFLTGKGVIEADLVEWLRGFGERLLASPVENEELARRLVKLGELSVGKVGDVGYQIGRSLLERVDVNQQSTENIREEEIQVVDADDESTTNEAETWFNLGYDQFIAEDFAGAIASYDQALKIKPYDHTLIHRKYHRQVWRTIPSYDQALKIKLDFHEAWFEQGNALGNLGRYEEAIASYDQALKIKPDDNTAWCNRGVILCDNLGRYEEAIASYDQALKIKPDDNTAWYNRGVALGNLGRYEEAIASYEQALKIKPDDNTAWYNRGVALSNLGRYEEALASYDQALKIKPDDNTAWYNRGVALNNLGRYEEALASFDHALKIKPDDYEAWLNLGMTARNSVNYNPLPSLLLGIIQSNSALNQRGYEGELAIYNEGLKYCLPDKDPEGWGKLHKAIGNAHYSQAQTSSHRPAYWKKAADSYNKALKTLTETDFPELHLEVLRDLIKVRLDLREIASNSLLVPPLLRVGNTLLSP